MPTSSYVKSSAFRGVRSGLLPSLAEWLSTGVCRNCPVDGSGNESDDNFSTGGVGDSFSDSSGDGSDAGDEGDFAKARVLKT